MLLSSRSLCYCKPNASIIPSLAAIVAVFLFTFSICYRDEITSTWNASPGVSDWAFVWGGTQTPSSRLARELLALLNLHSPARAESLHTDAAKKARADRWSLVADGADEHDRALMSQLNVTSRQTLIMKKAHVGFVQALEEDEAMHLLAAHHSANATTSAQGIVTVGGGSYFPPLLVSLRLLRRTGTTLPVEVFLPKEEYEPELCERVLPGLDAACRTFDHLDGRISRYQYKVFAVLLSSFAEVLWLDADNFPLHDVAPLFSSAPFQTTGLVTWPDLWQTSVSPAYYEIAARPPTPVSARASTESGQLLVSKEKHWKTLLLAAYYNYYGPDYYYPLLCQARAGAGDKETFLPAAEAMGLPFYDVKAPAQSLGHFRNKTNRADGLYRFALVQGDPVRDYEITRRSGEKASMGDGAAEATGSPRATSEDESLILTNYEKVPPFFLHMMTPKCMWFRSGPATQLPSSRSEVRTTGRL